jgi:putative addiction module component (TIGR02574 family)
MIQKSPRFPFQELSVDERLILVGEIWDSIADEPEKLLLTPAQKAELDRRLAEHRANPKRTFSWDEVKAHLRSLARERRASA